MLSASLAGYEPVGETQARARRRVQLRGGARRPQREAYSLYVERAAEGANEADGPLSSLYDLKYQVSVWAM